MFEIGTGYTFNIFFPSFSNGEHMRSRWLQIGVQEPAWPHAPNVSISFKQNAQKKMGRRHKSKGQESDAQRVTQGL